MVNSGTIFKPRKEEYWDQSSAAQISAGWGLSAPSSTAVVAHELGHAFFGAYTLSPLLNGQPLDLTDPARYCACERRRECSWLAPGTLTRGGTAVTLDDLARPRDGGLCLTYGEAVDAGALLPGRTFPCYSDR